MYVSMIVIDDDDFDFILPYIRAHEEIFSSLWWRNRAEESPEDFGALVEEENFTITVERIRK